MRLHRSVLAGIALGALLPVSAAQAATGVTAAGDATSTATLVTISVGKLLDVVPATTVHLGTLKATAGTTSKAAPAVSFIPATVNGTETGAVTVTPANSPLTAGGDSIADLGVIAATTPAATLKATDGAVRSSGFVATLGEASLLGLPITLDGGVDAGSVSDASHAQAGKTLKLESIELPNIADLLAALGIDITKLPIGTLNALIDDLRITLSSAAQTAFDNANTGVDNAAQALADGQAAVTTATGTLATETADLDAALAPVAVPPLVTLPDGVSAPLDHADWDQLSAEVKQAIIAVDSNIATHAANYETAKGALATAQGAIAGLQAAVDAALATLAGVVEGALAGVPLVEIGLAEIGTKALVGKTKTADVTGTISGVKVLGTDILAEVTGDSTVDVAEVADELANEVNATLNTVASSLSNALSEVTGAAGLVVPAPQVELLVKETSTGVDGAFGTAAASISALSISLGSVTVPAVYALEDAAELVGLAEVTGGFQTAPLAMKVGTITEAARYRAASTPAKPGTTPGTTPTHPATGGPAGLAIVAVIGAALAVGVRRRLRAGTE